MTISPYIFALLYWVIFYSFVTTPSVTAYAFIAFIATFFSMALVAGGARFYRQWNFWLSNAVFFLSSFGFVMILTVPTVRNLYIAFFGCVAGLVIYVARRYYQNQNQFIARSYLRFIGFIYLIAFWQSISLIYFLTISYDASLAYAVGFVALLTFVLGRGIIETHGLKKSSEPLVLTVLTLTTAQFFLFAQLLPLHYYVLGALLLSWFFFVVEMVLAGQEISSRRQIFKRYASLLIVVIVLLLITATWE